MQKEKEMIGKVIIGFWIFQVFCICLVRHSRDMLAIIISIFSCFLLEYLLVCRYFDPLNPISSQEKNNTVIQDNLASYLVYGTEGIIRV